MQRVVMYGSYITLKLVYCHSTGLIRKIVQTVEYRTVIHIYYVLDKFQIGMPNMDKITTF